MFKYLLVFDGGGNFSDEEGAFDVPCESYTAECSAFKAHTMKTKVKNLFNT